MLAHKVSKNNHTIQRFWAKKCTIWCFFIFRLSITYIIYNVERRIYPRQTTRTYLGSAPRLSRKRLVLISEAPRAYLGSASCLSRKRLALIWEAHGLFGGRLRRFEKTSETRTAQQLSASYRATELHIERKTAHLALFICNYSCNVKRNAYICYHFNNKL